MSKTGFFTIFFIIKGVKCTNPVEPAYLHILIFIKNKNYRYVHGARVVAVPEDSVFHEVQHVQSRVIKYKKPVNVLK